MITTNELVKMSLNWFLEASQCNNIVLGWYMCNKWQYNTVGSLIFLGDTVADDKHDQGCITEISELIR